MCEISIIIPVYNKQKYIAKTLESVLDQTFRDFEILLIDDGSTDGSGMVCDNLASSDARRERNFLLLSFDCA
jgi:glycosyltransferase involved in cell wall biosynthesis